MVVRLTTGRRVAGAVRYNERKVEAGQAVQLAAENFAHPALALASVAYKTKTMEHLTRRNPRVARPCLHAALAFHPGETLTDAQLRRIAAEFMNAIGYQTQPYLLYRHHDTAHPHVHVVTVSVAPDGRRIPDAFLHRRVSRVRRRLEQRHGLRPAQGPAPEQSGPAAQPTDEARHQPVAVAGLDGEATESLRLLRLVERYFRALPAEPDRKGGGGARACTDDLVLRHGVPPPAARRAVALFLASRTAPPGASPTVEETTAPAPAPKRGLSVRRRPH